MPGKTMIFAGIGLLALNFIILLINSEYEVFSTVFGAIFLIIGLVQMFYWELKPISKKNKSIKSRIDLISYYALLFICIEDPYFNKKKVEYVLSVANNELQFDIDLSELEEAISNFNIEDLDYELKEIKSNLSIDQKNHIISYLEEYIAIYKLPEIGVLQYLKEKIN